jgi:inositol phosphorylceramide mannosyltransferase catalytic subunit
VIPRKIHRVWVGDPMPERLERYGDTWKQHHPDWEHVLWTEANMPPLRNQHIYDRAEELAPGHVGQLRSDVARYEILLDHGGVYVDADLECLRPIDGLLDGVTAFAGWEKDSQWVGNTILGAVPGHSFMRALVTGLAANVRRHAGARPNALTGPRYVTAVRRRHGRAVTMFPQRFFYAAGWDELDRIPEEFPDAYAWHWWGNQRCKQGQPGWEYAR